MKLLFDQNISYRILKLLQDSFPLANQVRELGLENKTDSEIWEFARLHGYTIVTFDSDFCDIANLMGHPPKIIWLRTGNRTTKNLATLLQDKRSLISEFIEKEAYQDWACLELT